MNEIQKSGTETEFSLAALELNAIRPKTHAAREDGELAQPAAPTFELTLNGTQLLLALGAVLSLTAVLLWVVPALLDLCSLRTNRKTTFATSSGRLISALSEAVFTTTPWLGMALLSDFLQELSIPCPGLSAHRFFYARTCQC
jgi:hypothetical protein